LDDECLLDYLSPFRLRQWPVVFELLHPTARGKNLTGGNAGVWLSVSSQHQF
jgi:hypothetical protein